MSLVTSWAEIENSSVAITTGGAPGSAVESKPVDTASTAVRIAAMSLSEGGGGGGGGGGLAAAAAVASKNAAASAAASYSAVAASAATKASAAACTNAAS